MTFTTIRIAAISMLVLMAVLQGSASTQNLLKDPQVQAPDTNWHSWARRGQPSFHIDNTTGHGDNTSLKISSLEKGVDGAWLQDVRLVKLQTYNYSFWFRTETPGETVSILIEFPLADGVYMGQHNRAYTSNGLEWTQVTGSFKSPITGKAQFEVWKNLDNAGTGTAWFDDLALTEIISEMPDIDIRIEQPVNRVLSQGLDEIVCRINQRNPRGPSTSKYSAQVIAGSDVITEISGNVGRTARFKVPLTGNLPDGKINVTFRVFDKDGKVIFERTDILIKQSLPPRVNIGAHKELLVDGKGFFPIIVCWPTVEDIKDLPACGFNSFHIGMQSVDGYTPFVKEANRLGLMFIPEFSEMLRYGKTEYDEVKARVNALQQDPSLLCYWLIDEPDLRQSPPAVIQQSYNDIKELDPNHPVMYDEPAMWQIEAYQNCADIIGIDPYLMPAQVARYLKTAMTDNLAGRSKPVWIVIGVCPMEGMPEWPSAPSTLYVRNCVYAALASGARGIMYFSYRFTNFNLGTSEILHPLGRLNREINRMSRYLLTAEPVPVKASDKEVIAARFDSTQGSLLLVANTSKDRSIDVIIDLPDIHGIVFGLFDGKKAECPGKLRLTLKPYDTRAFKLK